MWPYIGDYVESILRDKVEGSVRASLPSSLQSFKFSKIDLGDIVSNALTFKKKSKEELCMKKERGKGAVSTHLNGVIGQLHLVDEWVIF